MDMPSLFFKYLFHKHPKKRKEKWDGVRIMMFNATDGIVCMACSLHIHSINIADKRQEIRLGISIIHVF
jgi:hypothetical protein